MLAGIIYKTKESFYIPLVTILYCKASLARLLYKQNSRPNSTYILPIFHCFKRMFSAPWPHQNYFVKFSTIQFTYISCKFTKIINKCRFLTKRKMYLLTLQMLVLWYFFKKNALSPWIPTLVFVHSLDSSKKIFSILSLFFNVK